MEKSRKDKGITLIALIITIIVLLILALVTINAIQGDGDLIAHANNAKTLYSQEGENENAFVQNSLAKIKKYIGEDIDNKNTRNTIYYDNSVYSGIATENMNGITIGDTIYVGFKEQKIMYFSVNCGGEKEIVIDEINGNTLSSNYIGNFVFEQDGKKFNGMNTTFELSETITISELENMIDTWVHP